MSTHATWKSIRFHNRHGAVVIERDEWSPYMKVVAKKPGIYRLSVFNDGYRQPIVKSDLDIADGTPKVVRLPARMTDEYLERLYLRLVPIEKN
jgi:hypothetical protein